MLGLQGNLFCVDGLIWGRYLLDIFIVGKLKEPFAVDAQLSQTDRYDFSLLVKRSNRLTRGVYLASRRIAAENKDRGVRVEIRIVVGRDFGAGVIVEEHRLMDRSILDST